MTQPHRPGRTSARGLTRRTIALAVAGVVSFIALVAGGVWWYTSTQAANREKAIVAAVEGFYGALAEADAPRAVGHVAGSVTPGELLTSEVLAASQLAAPIAGVQLGAVATAEPYETATVPVSYTVGGETVTTDVALTREGSAWKIDEALTELTLTGTEGLTVNGVDPTQATHLVLPGTYTAAPASEAIALDGTPVATVAAPGADPVTIDVTPELSERAATDVTAAAKKALETCLDARVSAPPGCPWSLDEKGATVKPGSVRYSLENDPWKGFEPTLDLATMTARGRVTVEVEATATVTFEGRTGEVTAPIDFTSTLVSDLTTRPYTVAWTS